MSVFHNNMLVGASQPSGVAFDTTLVPNSIFFDGKDTSGDTMTRTSTTPDNRNRWLFGTWYHPLRQPLNVIDRHTIFAVAASKPADGSGTAGFALTHEETGDIRLFHRDEDETEGAVVTTGVFRDTTSWYHILVDFDSANSNANDRISLYVNGVRVGAETGSSVGQNKCVYVNTEGEIERIGSNGSTTPDNHISAYLAQTFLMDNKSIANGDHATTDFLDTFTFGTNGSQVIPKSNDDIKTLVAAAGPNSFYLNYEDTTDKGSVDGMTRDRKATESTNHVLGITPTLTESIQGGATSNVTNGQRSRGALETTGTTLTLLFDLGSGNEQAVQSVSFTTEGFTDFARDPGQGNSISQTNGRIKDLTISGSNNGTDFTTLSSSTVAQKRSNALHVVSWSNTTAYRYLKFANANIHGGLRSNVGGLGFHTEQSPVIGNDFWGDKNHSTSSGASEINQTHQTPHTPSLVFPVLNSLNGDATLTGSLGFGNRLAIGNSDWDSVFATKSMGSSGKYYYEVRMHTETASNGFIAGIHEESTTSKNWANYIGNTTATYGLGYSLYTATNGFYTNGSVTSISGYTSNIAEGDIVMMAVDLDNNKIYWGVNGTFFNSGDPANGTGAVTTIQADTEYVFGLSTSASEDYFVNFGQDSTFGGNTTAGGNTDTNGVGDFKYTVPTGFQCLASKSLTAPTYQGIDYFDTTLYEGNGDGGLNDGQRVGDFVPFTDVYTVTNSAMFNDDDARSLTLNPSSSATDATKAAISIWTKRGNKGDGTGSSSTNQRPFTIRKDGNNYFSIYYNTSDQLDFTVNNGGSTILQRITTRKFRDSSAWHNIVVIFDQSNGTEADRVKIFYDGVQIPNTTAGFGGANTCTLDGSSALNFLDDADAIHNVGGGGTSGFSNPYDGYIAEVVFLDGADSGNKIDASHFGQLDTSTNRWVAKDPSSYGFGNMGYYLEFKGVFGGFSLIDNSSSTVSGNMTNGGGLSAIFDGNTSKNNAQSAQGANTNDNDSFVVVDHGEAKTVSKFIAFGSTEAEGLDGDSGSGTITFTLRGSTDNFSSSDVQLFQGTASESAGGLRSHEVNSGITSGAFQFHKMIVQTNTTNAGEKFGQLAQLQYFETAATNAGTDTSGNGNNFTENGTFELSDQVLDCPSQNFDNLGGLQIGGTVTEGHTKAALGSGGNQVRSNFNLSSGKFYVESDIQATNDSASIGLVPAAAATFSNGPGRDSNGGISYESDGDVFSDNVQNATAEASFSAGDVIQMAVDMDAKKVYFGKNNTFGGNPSAGTGGHALPQSILKDGRAVITVGNYSGTQSSTQQINYGQFLNFDAGPTPNGFKFTPPTGFKAVNQDNLDDTSDKITAWSWIKNRDAADSHIFVDRVRGVGKVVHADNTTVESTEPNTVQRFFQRGVQVGNDVQVNTNNESYVLWQWLVGQAATTTTIDASSTTPTNSLASTVVAADAGHFSVVGFTGSSGAARTIAHGMGGAPEMMIFMNREQNGANRTIYHKEIGATNYILFTSAAKPGLGNVNYFNNTEPDDTVFTVGSGATPDTNGNGQGMIVYCFRSVPGVCKVGTYTGNNDANGSYVHTGFKPALVMTKTLSSGAWGIMDSKRDPDNPVQQRLFPSSNDDEDTDGEQMDFLSDGFKLRKTGGFNNSGETYIYMAMAEIGGNGTLPPIYGR